MKCIVCGSTIKGEPRSLSQNSYLHVICKIAGDDLGYDLAEMKECFRRRFLIPKVVSFGGEMIEIYPSTSSLKKAQFAKFIDDIIRVCAEIGITIPNSEEYYA